MELPKTEWTARCVESLHHELTEIEEEWNENRSWSHLGDMLDRHFGDFQVLRLDMQVPLPETPSDYRFRIRARHQGKDVSLTGAADGPGTAMCRAIWRGWGTVLEIPPQDRPE